jgi:hypothetical protein
MRTAEKTYPTDSMVAEKPKPSLGDRLAKEREQTRPDLCVTCNNSATCMYLKNKKSPIYECEEFDGYAVPPTESMPFLSPKVEKAGNAEFKGLCVNCESRETCTFPKSEGGIWHCEDYK